MLTQREADNLLVTRFKAGERYAFDLLVIKYQTRLIRLVSRLINNQTQAEDIVQETFIKAFRSLGQFRGDSAFYTWLYRIGINSAKCFLIHQGMCPPAADNLHSFVEGVSDHNENTEPNTPESILIGKQLALAIQESFDGLPLDLRTALVLREVEGMSYQEIAGIMKCPIGTVRSRISRARDLIAERLPPFTLQIGRRW